VEPAGSVEETTDASSVGKGVFGVLEEAGDGELEGADWSGSSFGVVATGGVASLVASDF